MTKLHLGYEACHSGGLWVDFDHLVIFFIIIITTTTIIIIISSGFQIFGFQKP